MRDYKDLFIVAIAYGAAIIALAKMFTLIWK